MRLVANLKHTPATPRSCLSPRLQTSSYFPLSFSQTPIRSVSSPHASRPPHTPTPHKKQTPVVARLVSHPSRQAFHLEHHAMLKRSDGCRARGGFAPPVRKKHATATTTAAARSNPNVCQCIVFFFDPNRPYATHDRPSNTTDTTTTSSSSFTVQPVIRETHTRIKQQRAPRATGKIVFLGSLRF